ncbi:transmembrane protein, putative (macronuclear) [Tetrahymena thermophila SB210]|uniref:Transmembrane protein, putative n=1 Tax=Tetrahymena thermophila (strain SB210) TaxID=312017 RepID=I7MH39_TETTS|nr:transmembrane protein, putative [Tetrahymena thermophila SB210]EAS02600.2 transmembrane protein, putative [Tetrahymena thermophila SB210]|eukprot:XP_001022845.2 transmembrane protein, putative [Tetrahymena thermophila SB210]
MSEDNRLSFSWIIIFSYIFIIFLELLYLFFKIGVTISAKIKKILTQRQRSKVIPSTSLKDISLTQKRLAQSIALESKMAKQVSDLNLKNIISQEALNKVADGNTVFSTPLTTQRKKRNFSIDKLTEYPSPSIQNASQIPIEVASNQNLQSKSKRTRNYKQQILFNLSNFKIQINDN